MSDIIANDRKYEHGRVTLLAFALLTAVNLLSDLCGLDSYFFASILLSYMFFKNGAVLTVVSVLILALAVTAYILSKRRSAWLLIGLIIICIDTAFNLFLLWGFSTFENSGVAIYNLVVDLILHVCAIVFLAIALKHRTRKEAHNESITE